MAVRRDIPLEEFSVIISPPSNRLESTSVNIYSDGKFNLNGKLTEKLGGKKIKIQFTPDCRYLCLLENGDISIPKGGSRKLPEVSDLLKKNGIMMPVKNMNCFIVKLQNPGRENMRKTLSNCHPEKSAAQRNNITTS